MALMTKEKQQQKKQSNFKTNLTSKGLWNKAPKFKVLPIKETHLAICNTVIGEKTQS
jgi:hypothetical protein